ncbi:conserved hypothetical protein [Rhodospirillaceae bacterium LM-1]|nr:conserved hypothetical protein [Rhodospirillaceae bacterium LM-1]
MGQICQGPPWEFALPLKAGMGLDVFIETGTFQGATAIEAARHFRRVVTIELSPRLFMSTEEKLLAYANIECLLGDSRRHLSSLLSNLPPAMFWLDAHWTGLEITAGANDECPLMGEIETIAPHLDRHVVLIDDASLFLSPPPRGHNAAHWPGISDVVDALRRHHRPFIAVFDDVIAAIPASGTPLAKEILIDLATTRDLERRTRSSA